MVVPVLIRPKKDKKLGMIMAANNPVVVEQVNNNLAKVLEDLENGRFKEHEL